MLYWLHLCVSHTCLISFWLSIPYFKVAAFAFWLFALRILFLCDNRGYLIRPVDRNPSNDDLLLIIFQGIPWTFFKTHFCSKEIKWVTSKYTFLVMHIVVSSVSMGPPRRKRDGVIWHILERENGNWIKNCVIAWMINLASSVIG